MPKADKVVKLNVFVPNPTSNLKHCQTLEREGEKERAGEGETEATTTDSSSGSSSHSRANQPGTLRNSRGGRGRNRRSYTD